MAPLWRGLGAAAALALGLAGPLSAETLTDALVGAYKTSGLLDQNRALLRAADEDVALAVAALYPVLNYSLSGNLTDVSSSTNHRTPVIGTSPVTGLPTVNTVARRAGGTTTTATLSLTAQFNLYDGGRNRLAVDAAKESVLRRPRRAAQRRAERPAQLRDRLHDGAARRGVRLLAPEQRERDRRGPGRRPRPLRGRRDHPHRCQPGRGAARRGQEPPGLRRRGSGRQPRAVPRHRRRLPGRSQGAARAAAPRPTRWTPRRRPRCVFIPTSSRRSATSPSRRSTSCAPAPSVAPRSTSAARPPSTTTANAATRRA